MGDKPYEKQGKEFGYAMNQIAYGETMMAAVRDYAKEVGEGEKPTSSGNQQFNVEELFDDPELLKMHRDRLAQIEKDSERRVTLTRMGHGEYSEITEGDFLEICTKTDKFVCHFFHKDFERCKILDMHFSILSKKYFDTRFVKLDAEMSPFFVVKLDIKILPAILVFKGGVVTDRIVGFESFGQRDDFPTSVLEDRLWVFGILGKAAKGPDDEDEEEYVAPSKIRQGGAIKTASDEDSDFDDV